MAGFVLLWTVQEAAQEKEKSQVSKLNSLPRILHKQTQKYERKNHYNKRITSPTHHSVTKNLKKKTSQANDKITII